MLTGMMCYLVSISNVDGASFHGRYTNETVSLSGSHSGCTLGDQRRYMECRMHCESFCQNYFGDFICICNDTLF